ncbi:serine/threonine-protein kinase [Haliangium ochraceum]|nr:serine/threonine-protein kinase [Haliangium ochraceum]
MDAPLDAAGDPSASPALQLAVTAADVDPLLAPQRRASDVQDRWLGRLVDDRYRVLESIGRGGMGAVYKIEHVRMGKIAAMKVLRPEYSREPAVIERFRREAAAVSRLTHPNTVQVFDFGSAHGALYLVMEFVRGPDLNALLKRDGPMPFGRVAPMLAQICAALDEAHAQGIVHRDLKPENVLVTRTHRGRDFVKVLDFGLAKLGAGEERSDVTDRGAIIGTPYYMSPEQIRGEPVDARTDIYALGAMLYRMLTGTYAFSAGTPVGVLTKHLTDPLEPASVRAPSCNIPPRVDAILARAMAKEREQRYPDVGALLDEVGAAWVELTDVSAAHASSLDMPQEAFWQLRTMSGRIRALTRDDSDEIDYGIDSAIRLRRSDLDSYERSLRRRRRVRVASLPLLLAIALGVGYYALWMRPQAPRRAEHEPNNEMDAATVIAPERAVSGYLGKRLGKTEPDRDYYRLDLPETPQGPLVVSAHLSGLPNIDSKLSLLDPTGKVLAQVDEFGVGGDEWLRRVRVQAAVFVLVTEAMDVPRLPVENVSDTYQLSVSFAAESESRESEPNDNPSDAHPLRLGQPVTAYLDRRGDVDVYRFEGASGRYRLRFEGPEELPLTWRVGDQDTRSERELELELATGQVLHVGRADAAPVNADPAQIAARGLPGAALPYTVSVLGE